MSKHSKVAQVIVAKIVADISGRSGLGNEWDGIDPDIEREIVAEWESIVDATMSGIILGAALDNLCARYRRTDTPAGSIPRTIVRLQWCIDTRNSERPSECGLTEQPDGTWVCTSGCRCKRRFTAAEVINGPGAKS